jgi:hypothetical protein
MLKSLHIRNFALIAEAKIEFTPVSIFSQVKPGPESQFD